MNIQIFPLVGGNSSSNSSRLLEVIFVYTLVKLYNKVQFGQSHDVARHLTRVGLFYSFASFLSCTVKRFVDMFYRWKIESFS